MKKDNFNKFVLNSFKAWLNKQKMDDLHRDTYECMAGRFLAKGIDSELIDTTIKNWGKDLDLSGAIIYVDNVDAENFWDKINDGYERYNIIRDNFSACLSENENEARNIFNTWNSHSKSQIKEEWYDDEYSSFPEYVLDLFKNWLKAKKITQKDDAKSLSYDDISKDFVYNGISDKEINEIIEEFGDELDKGSVTFSDPTILNHFDFWDLVTDYDKFDIVKNNIEMVLWEDRYDESQKLFNDMIKDGTNNSVIHEEYDPYIIYRVDGQYRGTPKSNFDAQIQDVRKIMDLSEFDNTKQIKDYFFKYGFIKTQDDIIIDRSARIDESYEELDGTKVLTYTNYNNAKKEAEKRGFKEAEYGDYYNSDLSYCIWTKSGTLDDDFRIEAYYKFDENGKTRPLTKSEAELDNMQHGHGKFEDSDELISEEWTQLARKSVQDSDGFYTDYTLWKNNTTGKFECIFGDSELYTPENEYPDAEFETEEEAREWFDSYKGYEDDEDMFESKSNDVSGKPTKVNRGLLKYLFDEVEFTGRSRAEPDIDRLSSYDDVVEYYDDTITKKEFKDNYDYLVKLVFDAKYYYSDDDREVYIQLSDNHTMWDINADISEYKYSDMVDFAISEFESETGVDLYLLGRSGRHVCVELTLDNLERYKELSEIQSKLEKELVNDINSAEIKDVSVDYKTTDDLNETIEVEETMNKRYFKAVEKIGNGNYYTAYFINADYQSDAEKIAKKHAERYGNEFDSVILTTDREVEAGKKRGMSVIEEGKQEGIVSNSKVKYEVTDIEYDISDEDVESRVNSYFGLESREDMFDKGIFQYDYDRKCDEIIDDIVESLPNKLIVAIDADVKDVKDAIEDWIIEKTGWRPSNYHYKKFVRESINVPDMSQLRSNIMEFPNGEYFYIEYKDGELIAGGATNVGIIPEFSIDYDSDSTLDANVQNLYDKIVESRPELLFDGDSTELSESCKSDKCEHTTTEESYNILDSYSVYEIKDAITGKIIQKISTTDEDENDQNTWISDEEVIKDYADDNIIITKYNYDGNNILDDSVVIYPEEDYDLNESCTSNKCDYTDDGKDDIVRKYEIKMNGEFLEYVTGTEWDIIDKINGYIFADRDDKMAFMIDEVPTYTYEVVDEDEVIEDLKFDVDENFRIRESNRNI